MDAGIYAVGAILSAITPDAGVLLSVWTSSSRRSPSASAASAGPCRARCSPPRSGLAGVMVCFAALCLLAIVFVYRFLPETRGLPVEEIVRVFERQPALGDPNEAKAA